MLQLLDLAKENAALKSELARIRQEVEALQCLLAGGDGSAPLETLLAELDPSTDLARLVERVYRNNLSRVVVSAPALTAWQKRDPAGWEKVSAWLAAKGVTIVRVSEDTNP